MKSTPLIKVEFILLFTSLILAGCGSKPVGMTPTTAHVFTPTTTIQPVPATQTSTPGPTATSTLSPSPAPTEIHYGFLDPAGCKKPPEDYTLVEVNGWYLNQRTLSMLEYAASLYQGEIEITGYAITQGSYHDNGAASFGTHLGGGAVDLSVMRKGMWHVLYGEIPRLIRALRVAGFAAWLRDFNEVYSGSAIHIHAVAVGDQQLSQPASDQLTGTFGYFLGFTAIPQTNGVPLPDRHGGPILCKWMLEEGYADLRSDSAKEADAKQIASNCIWDNCKDRRIEEITLPAGILTDYTVQPGDTIVSIANQLHTTIEAIVSNNQIPTIERLEVGQKLVIPVNIIENH